MHTWRRRTGRRAAALAALAAAGWLPLLGCGSGGSAWDIIGSAFSYSSGGSTDTGPTTTGRTGGSTFGQADRTPVDPCTESLARKFITISMRNYCTDYIHYFFVAIAFVDVDETAEGVVIPSFDSTQFPDGAVCPDDVSLYLQNGYQQIRAGEQLEFGDYCLTGPALYYYHRGGRFRISAGSGSTGLGSVSYTHLTLPTIYSV